MDIATTIEAGAALIGILGGGVTFSFIVGKFTASVDANTKATEKLGTIIDGHLTWSAEKYLEATDKFAQIDKRIAVIEVRDRNRR